MKRTALILAMTLAMAPMAHAQQAPATTGTPESTTTPGGGGVGIVNAGFAIAGLAVVGAVIGLIAGSDDNPSGVVGTSTTTSTTTATSTSTATGTATGTGR
jgi:hypothetical protein